MEGNAMNEQLHGQYSVYQFFVDGSSEVVRSFVGAEEAVITARRYTESVGARLGTTVRVTITDGVDFTNFEWKFGEGVTFPPRDASSGKYVEDGDET